VIPSASIPCRAQCSCCDPYLSHSGQGAWLCGAAQVLPPQRAGPRRPRRARRSEDAPRRRAGGRVSVRATGRHRRRVARRTGRCSSVTFVPSCCQSPHSDEALVEQGTRGQESDAPLLVRTLLDLPSSRSESPTVHVRLAHPSRYAYVGRSRGIERGGEASWTSHAGQLGAPTIMFGIVRISAKSSIA
jgi:hypothetical protein